MNFSPNLASAKRKKIRQERRRVQETRVRVRRLVGAEIRDEHWNFFTRCYNNTYRAHHSTPYLNLEFFRRLGATFFPSTSSWCSPSSMKADRERLIFFSPGGAVRRYWARSATSRCCIFECAITRRWISA